MSDRAYDRTWQHKVPKIDTVRTRTELEERIKPRKKIITTAKPGKRRP